MSQPSTPDGRLLRVLSVRQPFASAILHGGKNVENRKTAPQIAGVVKGDPWVPRWVVLHAGAAWYDAPGVSLAETLRSVRSRWPTMPPREEFLHGHALGIVRIVRVLYPQTRASDWRDPILQGNPWAHGPVCWILDHPLPFPEPVRCKGRLGLFHPNAAVRAAGERALGVARDRGLL